MPNVHYYLLLQFLAISYMINQKLFFMPIWFAMKDLIISLKERLDLTFDDLAIAKKIQNGESVEGEVLHAYHFNKLVDELFFVIAQIQNQSYDVSN